MAISTASIGKVHLREQKRMSEARHQAIMDRYSVESMLGMARIGPGYTWGINSAYPYRDSADQFIDLLLRGNEAAKFDATPGDITTAGDLSGIQRYLQKETNTWLGDL